MDKQIWCYYCHSFIEEYEETIQDDDGRIFHKECYEQMNTFTDDFGEATTCEY